MTLVAAQTDVTKAEEVMLFINESQVAGLENTMDAHAYQNASLMMRAFQMLRSTDLIWSRMVRRYLMGENDPARDDRDTSFSPGSYLFQT